MAVSKASNDDTNVYTIKLVRSILPNVFDSLLVDTLVASIQPLGRTMKGCTAVVRDMIDHG